MFISLSFKTVLDVFTTKIGLAVAWRQVYGVKRFLVLKASSRLAKGFLLAGLRLQIEELEARGLDLLG
jgi:hypothetical protein